MVNVIHVFPSVGGGDQPDRLREDDCYAIYYNYRLFHRFPSVHEYLLQLAQVRHLHTNIWLQR